MACHKPSDFNSRVLYVISLQIVVSYRKVKHFNELRSIEVCYLEEPDITYPLWNY